MSGTIVSSSSSSPSPLSLSLPPSSSSSSSSSNAILLSSSIFSSAINSFSDSISSLPSIILSSPLISSLITSPTWGPYLLSLITSLTKLNRRIRSLSYSQRLLSIIIIYYIFRFIYQYKKSIIIYKLSRKIHKQKYKESELTSEMITTALSIPQLPPDQEKKILLLSGRDLLKEINEKKLKTTDVLEIFLKQALRLQKQCNIFSETFFKSAREQAKYLDNYYEKKGKTKGRLHGLIITIKDCINIKGVDTTLGLCKLAFQPATEDALIVQVLKQHGGIIFGKTNVPQTMLSFENSNPLFGRTLNPYHPELTSGGSSGGEAVAVSGRASIIGIGTDVGGSIRIPAHFCGNFAIKPTSRRLSIMGFRASVPGQEAIPGVGGLISNNVYDLMILLKELFVRSIWDRDHEVVPLSLDEHECFNHDKLRIGYYIDDGFIPASPACARAVLMTVDALKKAGHTVVEFKPPAVTEAILLYYKLMTSDNCDTLIEQVNGEIYEDYFSHMSRIIRLPRSIKNIIAFILTYLLKEKDSAQLLLASGGRSVSELWKLQAEKKKYRQLFFESWQAGGHRFDLLLTPAHVLPAVPHRSYKHISYTASYTMLQNLLDLPAGIVPITAVQESDVYTTAPKNLLEKIARRYYHPDGKQNGLPVGIQVVGLPYEDETVLRGMRIISELIPFTLKPPTFGL